MATVGERLAHIEALSDENRRRLDALHDQLHGGPSCEWEQSIRGRLHSIVTAQASADKLVEALRETRRLQSESRKTKLSRWQWLYLAVCATLAAAAPYVVLLVH